MSRSAVPVEYAYHADRDLVVITVCEHPPAFELRWWADLIARDSSLPATAPVLVLTRDTRHPPPLGDLPVMAELAGRVRQRFGRRLALVTTAVGMAAVTQLLILLAGDADRMAAFQCEKAACAWLSGVG